MLLSAAHEDFVQNKVEASAMDEAITAVTHAALLTISVSKGKQDVFIDETHKGASAIQPMHHAISSIQNQGSLRTT